MSRAIVLTLLSALIVGAADPAYPAALARDAAEGDVQFPIKAGIINDRKAAFRLVCKSVGTVYVSRVDCGRKAVGILIGDPQRIVQAIGEENRSDWAEGLLQALSR